MDDALTLKKEERLKFFTYIFDDIESIISPIKAVNGTDLNSNFLSLRADSNIIVNNQYWSLIEKIVRPIITKNNDSYPNIDIYKILSCIEFSVLSSLPLIYNDTSLTEQHNIIITKEINGTLAFLTALKFMSAWDGFTEYFSSDKNIIEQILNYQEKSRKGKCLSIKDEHIKILSFSIGMSNIPIFTNATWWRSFSYNIYLYSNIAK